MPNRSNHWRDDKISIDTAGPMLTKPLRDGHSEISFPKLNSDHDEKTSQANTNALMFGSLADLTAHHLRNSNSSSAIGSSSKDLVIPKLSTKNNPRIFPSPMRSEKLSGNNWVQGKIDQNDSCELFNSNFCKTRNSPQKTDHEIQLRDTNIVTDRTIFARDSFQNTRTPSPEDWEIDLTTALSETFSHIIKPSCNSSLNLTEDLSHHISRLDIYSNTNTVLEVTENDAPNFSSNCDLNMSSLQHIKLPYSKEIVSLFGKILCRKWKSKKPYIRSNASIDVVKRFDFSIPSPDDKILEHLRKRL